MSKDLSSILDSDKDSPTKVYPTDARTLYNSRNTNLDYVFALADTDTRRFRIGKLNDKEVYLRVLTAGENLLIEALVQEAIAHRLKVNKNFEVVSYIEAHERAIITLMVASCPTACKVYDNLGTINDKAKLKYASLDDLNRFEIENLFKSHFELEAKLNVNIDEMSTADINYTVSEIKKKAIQCKDLNWHTLTQILEHLTSSEEPEE